MRKSRPEPGDLVHCARCGEDKPMEKFNRGDSYCKPCRRAYAREYHARRALEDPQYLADKAKKARDKYRKDSKARLKRLESARKYRTKERAGIAEKNKEADERWNDL